MKIDHIFVIHYDKEIERKKYLDEKLPSLNTPFSFRSNYNRESSDIFNSLYFDFSDINKNKRNDVMTKYGRHIPSGLGCTTEREKAYRAVTLEHFKTYEFIYNETSFNNVLILEDDVRFEENFLIECENNIPNDYDICYIGSGCDLKLPYQTKDFFGKHPQFFSKCSDSYIINRQTIKKIIDDILPFFTTIDWDLNYIQMLHQMNVYWATSPKIHQGSQKGIYNSCFNVR